jgi:hypothetical protein
MIYWVLHKRRGEPEMQDPYGITLGVTITILIGLKTPYIDSHVSL